MMMCFRLLEEILQASEGQQVGVLMNKTEDLGLLTSCLHGINILLTYLHLRLDEFVTYRLGDDVNASTKVAQGDVGTLADFNLPVCCNN